MTFLSPIPAIIAAAITLPVLIAMFLLKLRRRPVRVSSTMLWDQAVKDLQANVPFRWLRPSWMLVLSLMILALLLLALARPALDATAARTQTLVILIDRSASMNAHDAAPDGSRLAESRLDLAIARADASLGKFERAGFSGTVAVIAFAAEPTLITAPTRDISEARKALQTIEPTDQPGDLAPALQLVETIVQQQANEDDAPTGSLALIFTDGGFSSDLPLTLAGAEPRFERIGPDADAPRANMGIVALAARRDYDDPAIVRLFVRLQSTSPEPAGAILTMRLDGRLIDRRPVVIRPPAPDETSSNAASTTRPGQTALTLELPSRAGGLIQLALESPQTIPDAADADSSGDSSDPSTGSAGPIARVDALDADNTAAIRLDPPPQPALLLVRLQRGAALSPAQWILGDILTELEPRRLQTVDPDGYRALTADGSLGTFDAVIFEGYEPMLPPPIPSISFGAPLPGIGPTVIESEDKRVGRFLAWERDHPIMRAVALDQIIVRHTRVIPDAPGQIALARDRRGTLIAVRQDGPIRRLVVAFDLIESSWPVDISFAIFLTNAIDHLTLADRAMSGSAMRTTDPLIAQPMPGAKAIRVLDDAGTLIAQRTLDALNPTGLIALGTLPRVGLYSIEGGQPTSVAVNLLDANESALATADALTIAGQRIAGTSRGGTEPIELWPWLILAAGVLLVIEWVLHALRTRI